MSKKISVNLSSDGIAKLQSEINKYIKDINPKLELFISKLADCGIAVAKSYSTSAYGQMITYTKKLGSSNGGAVIQIVATSPDVDVSYWNTKEGDVTVAVSPLLMEEFGSGNFANSRGVEGVGQGTFPGQKHAKQTSWRWWNDEDEYLQAKDVEGRGKVPPNVSSGYEPSAPMYHAFIEMQGLIDHIAKEVFG